MDLVSPGLGLIVWQAIAFLLVLFLLRRYAWSPIISGLKARENSIQEAINKSEEARAETQKLKEENDQLLQQARSEREKILKDATNVADNIKEQAKDEASKITERMITEARSAIEAEKQAALNEVRNQVAQFSLQIAEKLLKANLQDEKSQRELVDEFTKDLNLN